MNTKITAVLGASTKPERYSNKAVHMLKAHGHEVIPVHPLHREVEGLTAVPHLDQLPKEIDTITVYLSPETSEKLSEAFIAAAPRRVIFNPGAESSALEEKLLAAGIKVENACTLVLLQTGQY